VKQLIAPGRTLDVLTAGEAAELLERQFRETVHERLRAPANILLDAAGNGQDEVYTVPVGWELEVRRVTVDISTAGDPSTGNVALNVAGRAVEYLRSGTRIEYAVPLYGPNVQVPGVQSWGLQGPYLRNGETFEVRARGLTANAILLVSIEGVLSRPPPRPDRNAGRG